jgi:anti-sigma factor RsiW
MEHEQALDRLDEWLDGELGEADSAALSRHLDGCEACRREAALRKRLGEALFAPLPPDDPRKNEAFVRRVMGRVAEEGSAPFWRRLAAGALTPALGLGLAALLFNILSPGLGAAEVFEAFDAPEAPVYEVLP